MSILPRYDAYGRMLGTSTDPDAEAHFTLYSVARNEIERVREQLRCLAQEVVNEDSRTVGAEGPSYELLALAEYSLKLGWWTCSICGSRNHPGNQLCEHRARPQHQIPLPALISGESATKHTHLPDHMMFHPNCPACKAERAADTGEE